MITLSILILGLIAIFAYRKSENQDDGTAIAMLACLVAIITSVIEIPAIVIYLLWR